MWRQWSVWSFITSFRFSWSPLHASHLSQCHHQIPWTMSPLKNITITQLTPEFPVQNICKNFSFRRNSRFDFVWGTVLSVLLTIQKPKQTSKTSKQTTLHPKKNYIFPMIHWWCFVILTVYVFHLDVSPWWIVLIVM